MRDLYRPHDIAGDMFDLSDEELLPMPVVDVEFTLPHIKSSTHRTTVLAYH